MDFDHDTNIPDIKLTTVNFIIKNGSFYITKKI